MPRENAEAKGRRYLTEGRLVVSQVDGAHVRTSCRGTGATHDLACMRCSWLCTCPARSCCAHLVALQLVTDADRRNRP
jgi:hypothetical protein